MTKTSVLSLTFFAAAITAFSLPALAGDATQEIGTATAHAGMGAAADDIGKVHAHMHHVLNCLEGPAGADFDAAQANPCKGQGDGAIPDSPADKRAGLQKAAGLAKSALAENDVAKAKAIAAKTSEALAQ